MAAIFQLAGARTTAHRPSMLITRGKDMFYYDGVQRGFKWRKGKGDTVESGMTAPTAGPVVSAGAGTGVYYLGYRYVDIEGWPSCPSPLRSVTGAAPFVWSDMQAAPSTRGIYVELLRTTANQRRNIYHTYGAGIAANLSSSSNDEGYVEFTTATAHGLQVGDFTVIAGHGVAEYNGEHRVDKVSSTTTFTTNVGYVSAAGAAGTSTQRIYRFGAYGYITSSADNGSGDVRFTLPAGHNLAVGAKILVQNHSVAGYNTTHEITAVTATTVDTDIAWSANGTNGDWVLTGFTLDSYGDTTLDDDPDFGLIAHDDQGSSGFEGTINRFVPPPTDRAVCVEFGKRLWFLVTVKYRTGTVTTTAGINIITGSNTAWTSEMVGRVAYIDGESEPYTVTEFISTTSLRVHKGVANTASLKSYVIKPDPLTTDAKVIYTEEDEPESADPNNSVTISQNYDDKDELTGAAPMGSGLYFLMARHIYRHNFAKQPRVSGDPQCVAMRGCINQRSWVAFEGQLYLLDEMGPWRFGVAGGGVDDLAFDIQDLIRDKMIDWSKGDNFFAQLDRDLRVVKFWVCFRGDEGDRPRRQLCYNIRTGQWWIESTAFMGGGATNSNMLGGGFRSIVGGQYGLCYLANHVTYDSPASAAGTVTSSTSSTVVVTGTPWSADQWNGGTVEIVAGTGKGQSATVSDGTSSGLVISGTWTTNPDTTSKIVVYLPPREDTCSVGSTTTVIQATTATMVASAWRGASIVFKSGANKDVTRLVTANTSGTLTIAPALSTAPASGDSFVIAGVAWRYKTGTLRYLSEEDGNKGTESYQRGMRATFSPTASASILRVRRYFNHNTTADTLAMTIDEGLGLTREVGGVDVSKSMKLTQSTRANASGNLYLPMAAGRIQSPTEGDRWVTYELRGVQTLDRHIIHELAFYGVGDS